MAVIYDKKTTALIFDATDPKERRTALCICIVFNTDDVRCLSAIRKRIDAVVSDANFKAQEYAEAIGLGIEKDFFSVSIPHKSPTLAVTMAITQDIVKAALEFPDNIVPIMSSKGYAFLKKCGR